jgi:hypothetical protein
MKRFCHFCGKEISKPKITENSKYDTKTGKKLSSKYLVYCEHCGVFDRSFSE